MKPIELLKLIPSQVRITRDVTYEVVWIDEFNNENIVGESRPDIKQIVLKKNESPTETFKTFLHEIFHSISDETKDLNLTEKQVIKLEESFFRLLKLNKII